jgi:histidyl-tRNA synthetase
LIKFQAVKGTKDILPAESYKWQMVEKTIRDVFSAFGYQEIRTPVFEDTTLFARGIGETTDVVGKEMYSFRPTDADDSITLRPEMTAGVVRAYLQHNLSGQESVSKLYYIGEMFRKEKPQAGRQRQFWQFGAECFGSSSPLADAEIIAAMIAVYKKLGISQMTLKLNSLGDTETRQRYRTALQDYLRPHFEELDAISKVRFDKNPLRILDSKNPALAGIIANAPRLADYLDDDSKKHFADVQQYLTDFGLHYELDFKLVRGLDYYSRTAFELVSTALGSQDALGGGGRYDGLAVELGNDAPVPAIGFACGMERLLIVMDKLGLFKDAPPSRTDFYFAALGDEAKAWVAKKVFELRTSGIRCEADLLGRSLKAQMREANKSGATFAVIIGEDELKNKKAQLKNLTTSEQTEIVFEDICGEKLSKYISSSRTS